MAYHRQTVARRSAPKQAAQARRLLAASHQGPSSLVLSQTIAVSSDALVIERTVERGACIDGVMLEAGQRYYLLASAKFTGRYYAACEHNGRIRFSCDAPTAMAVIAHIIDASMRGAMIGEEIAA